MNRSILNNEYKISIIMPVYNTEAYFDRCIGSVLAQSYRNIELIVVDDCSQGDIRERIQEYLAQDSRVRLISHEKNEGLLKARLTGAEAATGEYIAFIDSDDYVSSDYYHTLLDRAVSEKVDIVIGHTVHQDRDGYRFLYNLYEAGFCFDRLDGEAVRERFYAQEGQCYAWHTIWNKLYSKSLWDRCMPYYKRIRQHVIMTEDIAFSSVLFYFAESAAVTANDAYFYCANDNASTNTEEISMRKFEKNMQDIRTVFDFVESFLEEQQAQKQIKEHFLAFRKLYARIWNNIPAYRLSGTDALRGRRIMREFCPDETSCATEDDGLFLSITSPWNGGLESIKESILRAQDAYISFDIYDTLVQRPFLEPTDLFELLDKDFEQLLSSNLKFRQIRTGAEEIARRRYGTYHPDWQDITLPEIYRVMCEAYHIPEKIADRLMEREKQLELEFGSIRNAGRELYEAALLSGKQVILISDMYLERETIVKLLERNGYCEYSKLYLSSEIRRTKYNGSLYRYVRKELGIGQDTHIYHIGDTWQNDYINARDNGFDPILLPKAREIFENRIQGAVTNDCASIGLKANGCIVDRRKQYGSVGIGCMYAAVCNKYFDNPYRSFHPESDFNADPYLIGFYALGMHLAGLNRWITEECRKRKAEKIHFLARDGYLPMKAYEILNAGRDDVPEADYLYASRKAVLPGMIRSETDYYGLPVEYRNHSPESLLKVLEFASSDMDEETKEKICKQNGIAYHKVFTQKEEYLKFIDVFLQHIYDGAVYAESYETASRYYAGIGEKDIAFDMGYSGRIQNAVSRLAGRGVDVLFVHSDNDLSDKMARTGRFKIVSYYDFIPCISGLLREHMLSDTGAGCIGFRCTAGSVEPVLQEEGRTVQDRLVLGMLQQGALDFVTCMRQLFGAYEEYIPFRVTESSMPFEGYLRNAKEIDTKIFAASYFEDFVYGASKQINIGQFIHEHYRNEPVPGSETVCTESFFEQKIRHKGKMRRALLFLLLDKDTFRGKMADELRDKPALYRLGKWLWNLGKQVQIMCFGKSVR